MPATIVHFSDFDSDRLATTGPKPAKMPEGKGSADQISVDYLYPSGQEGLPDIQERLVIETPIFRTNRGIQSPQDANGKPAIPVTFDMMNKDHVLFLGSFGNKYEYTEDEEGRTLPVHSEPELPSGVLGSIYGWAIEQVAAYIALKAKKDKVTNKHYEEAASKIPQSGFWYKPPIGDDGKTRYLKYFKLMSFHPGQPDENSAKFYLPNGTMVNPKDFYNRGFEFSGVLSFRRIFLGPKWSVTMELTDILIHDIFDSSGGISGRSAAMIERMNAHNPGKADAVAQKYKELMEHSLGGTINSDPTDPPKPDSGFKIDEIVEASTDDFIDPSADSTPASHRPTKPALKLKALASKE